MAAEQILNEAFRLGRDMESHDDERETDPNNWDAVCEYVAEEMTKLVEELAAFGVRHPSQGG